MASGFPDQMGTADCLSFKKFSSSGTQKFKLSAILQNIILCPLTSQKFEMQQKKAAILEPQNNLKYNTLDATL